MNRKEHTSTLPNPVPLGEGLPTSAFDVTFTWMTQIGQATLIVSRLWCLVEDEDHIFRLEIAADASISTLKGLLYGRENTIIKHRIPAQCLQLLKVGDMLEFNIQHQDSLNF